MADLTVARATFVFLCGFAVGIVVAFAFDDWAITKGFCPRSTYPEFCNSHSLAAPIVIEPIVPMKTVNAPMIKTAFDTLKRQSAHAEDTFHISTFTVVGILIDCVVGLFAVFVALAIAVSGWPKRRRSPPQKDNQRKPGSDIGERDD